MAGWQDISQFLFLCVSVLVHNKKERGQYPAIIAPLQHPAP